jgi:hypothetical protein
LALAAPFRPSQPKLDELYLAGQPTKAIKFQSII